MKQNRKQIEKWSIFEISLNGPVEGNPFIEVELSTHFKFQLIREPQ